MEKYKQSQKEKEKQMKERRKKRRTPRSQKLGSPETHGQKPFVA